MAASGKRSIRKVEASTQSDISMLTIDDVRAIPLFSTLATTELQPSLVLDGHWRAYWNLAEALCLIPLMH
jgi:hypothetical protein